jgi:hypothetical protein
MSKYLYFDEFNNFSFPNKMNGSIFLGLFLIAIGIFSLYAIFFSENRTIKGWGYLIIGIFFIWFAYDSLVDAFNLFTVE